MNKYDGTLEAFKAEIEVETRAPGPKPPTREHISTGTLANAHAITSSGTDIRARARTQSVKGYVVNALNKADIAMSTTHQYKVCLAWSNQHRLCLAWSKKTCNSSRT